MAWSRLISSTLVAFDRQDLEHIESATRLAGDNRIVGHYNYPSCHWSFFGKSICMQSTQFKIKAINLLLFN
jgi:hypothetical protein